MEERRAFPSSEPLSPILVLVTNSARAQILLKSRVRNDRRARLGEAGKTEFTKAVRRLSPTPLSKEPSGCIVPCVEPQQVVLG